MGVLRISERKKKKNNSEEEKEKEGERRRGGSKAAGEIMGVPKNSPKSFPSPREKPTTLQTLFASESKGATNTTSSPTTFSPTHTTHRDPETQELLSIISSCTFVFTFTDPSEFRLPAKPQARQASSSPSSSTLSRPPNHPSPMTASSPPSSQSSPLTSLAPSLLPTAAADCPLPFDNDADPLSYYLNPAWPHVCLVYDILLKLVLNSDPNTLRAYVNHPFLLALLSLFQTEDCRERECLKNVFHRIYSKLPPSDL